MAYPVFINIYQCPICNKASYYIYDLVMCDSHYIFGDKPKFNVTKIQRWACKLCDKKYFLKEDARKCQTRHMVTRDYYFWTFIKEPENKDWDQLKLKNKKGISNY